MAIFTAIQGLNFIIWDKLTIQKDPKILFRESLERRRGKSKLLLLALLIF